MQTESRTRHLDIRLEILMGLFFAFVCGMFAMLGYILWRMMRNDGWDDSNITNALRLLSHVTLHSEDFGKMYYLTQDQRDTLIDNKELISRPFWYISEDELEGVVRTRP
jgi:hypothetical protein